MPVPPPSSTLFPYTTLFRSLHLLLDELREGNQTERRHCPCSRLFRDNTFSGSRSDLRSSRCISIRRSRRNFRARTAKDRKSTRLNSSHRCISYAVFCLKKKT